MEDLKKSIRPKLDLLKAPTETEQFQNEVLRPILKLQNAILLLFFINFSKKQKREIGTFSKEKLSEFIKTSAEKNSVFRNQLIGLIVGQFTKDEFEIYSENASEFNRRIVTMVRQRLEDNYQEILKI